MSESRVKMVVLIKKRDGMTRNEFLSAWQDEHPAVVWTLPGLRDYVQSAAIEHRKEWPYDGMAELWFDSVGAIKAAFDSPEAAILFEREEAFIASSTWFISEEKAPPKPAA